MTIILICLLIVVVLLFLLMIPIVFLFGLIGFSLKALWAMLLFVLKYGIPAALVGLVIAIIRDKHRTFIFSEYFMHIGIAALVGVGLMLLGLQMPVAPDFPVAGEVTSMAVTYERAGDTYRQEAWEQYQIEDMCRNLSKLQLKRTVTEFIETPDNEQSYDVHFTLSDGQEVSCTFYSSEALTLHTRGKTRHYKVRKDSLEVPIDAAANLFYEAKRIEADAIWQPFADEFFETIHYDSEDGQVYFFIPENIPEGRYTICTDITAVEFLEDGRENKLAVTPFEEQQKNSSWDPGHWYCFPLPELKYITFDFEVRGSANDCTSRTFSFDLMGQIPSEYHRYPF